MFGLANSETHGIRGEADTFELEAMLNKLNMLPSVKVYVTTFQFREC